MRMWPAVLLSVVLGAPAALAQGVDGTLLGLTQLQDGARSRRVSSFDRTGGNNDRLEHIPDGENEWGFFGPQRENPTGDDNYLVADIHGQGHYVGVNYYVQSPSPMWYGEGDDMFFIDGEAWPPSLHGTGTEDYFNTSWAPNNIFSHPFYGYGRVNDDIGWLGRTHVYRFHVTDPVYFEKSLRFSIEHGHNNNLTLDLATVAYWYQSEPHRPFPAMVGREERKPRPLIGFRDIHRWRHEWRKNRGGDRELWGDEPDGE